MYYSCQVLQRKTEEAAMATKRLKEVLDSRKATSRTPHGIEFINYHFTSFFSSSFYFSIYISLSWILFAGDANNNGPGIQVQVT